MKKLIISLLCSLLFRAIFAVDYRPGDFLNVYANSGLKLRSAPHQESEMIDIIPYGSQVQVVNTFEDDSSMISRIEWMDGRWILVDYDGLTGYVFDAFLSTLPFPDRKDQICSSAYDFAYTLGQYFDQHYVTETVLDSSFTLYKYLLENGTKVTRVNSEKQTVISLDIPDLSSNDVLNLMRSMIPDRESRSQFEKSILYVEDKFGIISQIRIDWGDKVWIRKKANGNILVKASGESGC